MSFLRVSFSSTRILLTSYSAGLIPLLKKILALDNLNITDSLIKKGRRTWVQWNELTGFHGPANGKVTIALVGKYIELHDSYLSVVKSLEHSAMRCNRKLDLRWVDAEHLESKARETDAASHFKAWHGT
jgi:CTP synthase